MLSPVLSLRATVVPRTLLRYISVRDTCMLRVGRLNCRLVVAYQSLDHI